MAGAEEQQAEGTVAALEVAMVPGQDALGVVDMTTPKASLIEVNQQLGPEAQKLHDREDGAAAEQQPQSGDVALAEQARHDVGDGEGGGVNHGAMKGKGGGKAAEVTEAEAARAAEEEAAATTFAAEEVEAAATKLAAEEVEVARAVEEEAAGTAPPLDKEASAIAGQKHEGGEGLGGCGRRELCYTAAGAGKKKPWPSKLRHAVLRAL